MITAEDIATVRREAHYYTQKRCIMHMKDDIVSDACLRLLKFELPHETAHRIRSIRRCVFLTAIDRARSNGSISRYAFERQQAGIPLGAIARTRLKSFIPIEAFDGNIAEATFTEPRDPIPDLARIGLSHPIEFFCITMHYLHGMNQRDLAKLMDVSQPRIQQWIARGLDEIRGRMAA